MRAVGAGQCHADRFSVRWAGGWLVQVASGEGRLSLVVVRGWPTPQPPRWDSILVGGSAAAGRLGPEIILYATHAPAGVGVVDWERFGLRGWYGRVTAPSGGGYAPPMPGWRVGAPVWMLAVATGAAPCAWGAARLIRRRQRAAPNACPRCGYDVRATPDRCPECGAAPAAATAQH